MEEGTSLQYIFNFFREKKIGKMGSTQNSILSRTHFSDFRFRSPSPNARPDPVNLTIALRSTVLSIRLIPDFARSQIEHLIVEASGSEFRACMAKFRLRWNLEFQSRAMAC